MSTRAVEMGKEEKEGIFLHRVFCRLNRCREGGRGKGKEAWRRCGGKEGVQSCKSSLEGANTANGGSSALPFATGVMAKAGKARQGLWSVTSLTGSLLPSAAYLTDALLSSGKARKRRNPDPAYDAAPLLTEDREYRGAVGPWPQRPLAGQRRMTGGPISQ